MSRAELRRIGAIAWKDVATERRTRANFNAVAAFAAMMLLLFGFALGPDVETLRLASSGILWLTILFSGILVFSRSYHVELEDDALESLLLYPGSRRSVFLGKLVGNLTFVLLVEMMILPMMVAFYHVPVRSLPAVAGVLLLGTLGFVTLGTFYAAMASRVRAREVLLPLLLFPMLVPLLVGAVQGTLAVLAGDPMGELGAWIRLLVAFDVVFLVASLLAFESVIEA